MTTVSVINPEVTYRESKTIEDEDIGYKSQVYELDLEGTEENTAGYTIAVVIGKPKYIYTDKNIIFFPIYAVQGSKIRSQIGVFEVKSAQLINVYKNGELDLQRLSKPLLYSFSKPAYLAKLGADPRLFTTAATAVDSVQPEISITPEPILEEEMREDAHLRLKLGKTHVSEAHKEAKEIMEIGVFEPIEGFTPLEPLTEETNEMAENERSAYKESSRDNWVQKYMRNSNYRIHEVEANGDCFFATIRDAFASIGRKTTV